jgi:glutathione S-transferase
MLTLYAIPGCPFAQRTEALLRRLGVPVEVRAVDPRNKSPEFLAIAPNGKTPVLVDGPLVLNESFVVNEYLAEKLQWAHAHASDPGLRARERLAMLQFDEVFVPQFYAAARSGSLPAADTLGTVRNLLRELERTILAVDGCDNLIGIHCAVHWVRMRWLMGARSTPVAPLVAEHPALQSWLDAATQLEAVQSTLPARQSFLSRW